MYTAPDAYGRFVLVFGYLKFDLLDSILHTTLPLDNFFHRTCTDKDIDREVAALEESVDPRPCNS